MSMHMLKSVFKPPEAGSNFRPAFFFLSKKQKRALSAVYAYCRCVDDIVDVPGNNDPADSIKSWREEIGRLYQGKPTCEISKNLLPAVSEYGLQAQDFLLILEGVEKDITVSGYETFADLEQYLYRVACAVGLLCVRIFGYDHSSAQDYAKWLGYAVQMTNILRDVSQDAARGGDPRRCNRHGTGKRRDARDEQYSSDKSLGLFLKRSLHGGDNGPIDDEPQRRESHKTEPLVQKMGLPGPRRSRPVPHRSVWGVVFIGKVARVVCHKAQHHGGGYENNDSTGRVKGNVSVLHSPTPANDSMMTRTPTGTQ